MRNRGMISWKTRERAYRSLFLCFLLALVSLAPHILRPTTTTPMYASLTVALVVVNAVVLRWFDRAPCVAFQSYWYVALAVISAMVFVDARRGMTDAAMPFIVALPTLATLAIRWFVSWRASWVYGLGALALIVPAGFAYRELGAFVLVAFVFLSVTVGRKREQTTLQGATEALEAENTRLANVVKRLRRE